VQQANAEKLLKSSHAAKRSVYNMAKMATKAKKAAFRLHKLADADDKHTSKQTVLCQPTFEVTGLADVMGGSVLLQLLLRKRLNVTSSTEMLSVLPCS